MTRKSPRASPKAPPRSPTERKWKRTPSGEPTDQHRRMDRRESPQGLDIRKTVNVFGRRTQPEVYECGDPSGEDRGPLQLGGYHFHIVNQCHQLGETTLP